MRPVESLPNATGPIVLALRWVARWGATMLLGACSFGIANAQDTFGPADPICAIDGQPVFLGELNLLLKEKLGARRLASVDPTVQRACSALLVKRHLAMSTLRDMGGDSLQSLLDRSWDSFLAQLKRQGSDPESYAKQRQTDEASLRRARDWDVAWGSYLKSRLNEENLRRFYQVNRKRYAPTKWKVSHLFLAFHEDQPDSQAIVQERMAAIERELDDQAESEESLQRAFAELAARESDGATADRGGDIGWVSAPGDLPRVVMDAIRNTPPGALAGPVRSPLGMHLVLVRERATEETPFEGLRDLTGLRRDAADAMFDALAARQGDYKLVWFIDGLRPPGQ
ncbi:peptidylprolyl isomerase [Roseiconus nitratireducens]|nr:peptidylprolyl isomerase [Roseiconus nitratireducens]